MPTLISNSTLWHLHPELCRDVIWRASATDDALLCVAMVDGQRWRVVLHSVDATALYGLYIEDRRVLDFDDWPGFWRWPA